MFKGPSAFAFGYDDVAAPARILKTFVKKAKKCELKGGIVENSILNATEVETIADMPSREVLIARMLGSMLSPISKFAIVVNEIARSRAENKRKRSPQKTGTTNLRNIRIKNNGGNYG